MSFPSNLVLGVATEKRKKCVCQTAGGSLNKPHRKIRLTSLAANTALTMCVQVSCNLTHNQEYIRLRVGYDKKKEKRKKISSAVFRWLETFCLYLKQISEIYWMKCAHTPRTELVVCWNSRNKMWIFRTTLFSFLHADMVTYLCCLTNRTSEPKPSKHTVLCMLTQCREPECNERDILMAFHLFMHRKWRGTVAFWNSWQNKEPTLGKWLYLWFHSDRWRYRERDRLTHLWQFKVLNDVMYGNILEHSL